MFLVQYKVVLSMRSEKPMRSTPVSVGSTHFPRAAFDTKMLLPGINAKWLQEIERKGDKCVCVCVCVCERERESVCVCVCVFVCV